MSNDHRCHVPGCHATVSPKKLMCPAHWRDVPRRIQEMVINNYQEGQCNKRKRPSLEWLAAARLAIDAVREKEIQNG